jgi:hypothetical protein
MSLAVRGTGLLIVVAALVVECLTRSGVCAGTQGARGGGSNLLLVGFGRSDRQLLP